MGMTVKLNEVITTARGHLYSIGRHMCQNLQYTGNKCKSVLAPVNSSVLQAPISPLVPNAESPYLGLPAVHELSLG